MTFTTTAVVTVTLGGVEPALQLVDQPVEQKVRGAAEDPPDSLLRNGMNVALEVASSKGLKVDHRKKQEIVIGQEKEVAEVVLQAGRPGLMLHVVKVNDHPEHEHGAQDRPEISRKRGIGRWRGRR